MRLSSTDRTLVELIRPALLPEETTTCSGIASGEAATPSPPSRIVIPDKVWSAVADRAFEQRLAPLLYVALKSSALADQPPSIVLERLRLEYLRTTTANWLAQEELASLLKDLKSQQVPVVLLKGIALAETLYSDSGTRSLGDMDLLIHQEDAPRVFAVLTGRDYAPLLEMTERFGEEFSSERCFVRRGRKLAQVDVHWHVVNFPYYRERTSVEWFWQQTEEIRVKGQPARVFLPEAQLLHLSAHFMLNHQGDGLRWSFDLALLLSKYWKTIKWDEVVEAARGFALDDVLQRTLAEIHAVWGTTVPSGVSAKLYESPARANGRYLLGIYTADRPEAQLFFDTLSLPGIRKKVSFIKQYFFPDAAYMQSRYRFSDARLLPLYYVLRFGIGVRRFVRSAITIAANIWRGFWHPQKA